MTNPTTPRDGGQKPYCDMTTIEKLRFDSANASCGDDACRRLLAVVCDHILGEQPPHHERRQPLVERAVQVIHKYNAMLAHREKEETDE